MLLGEIVTLRLQRTLFCYLRGCSLREITKQLGELTDERTVRVDVACLRHAFKDPRAKRYIREIVSFAGVDVKRLEELTGWHGWRRREDENMAGG